MVIDCQIALVQTLHNHIADKCGTSWHHGLLTPSHVQVLRSKNDGCTTNSCICNLGLHTTTKFPAGMLYHGSRTYGSFIVFLLRSYLTLQA